MNVPQSLVAFAKGLNTHNVGALGVTLLAISVY